MHLIADRYELLESLGSGGMARVHLARDTVLERRLAIKLLRDDIGADPTLRERFLREARTAGALNHRHIVRVYDAGLDGATPWMAMELVEGPSLRERMTDVGRYPLADAQEVMSQVLQALQAAHDADVVHRDIKPANILLGADGAKLGDFGIAKSLGTVGADLTQVNQFLGTPKYTAPEVATGDPATRRSDLYSAAVVFWEMLAGEPPYDHPNPLTLAMMHRTDPLPSLAQARPDLPPGVVAALEATLAKDPQQRPSSAAALESMLTAGSGADPGAAPAALAATQVLPTSPAAPVPPTPREQTLIAQRPVAPPPATPRGSRPWGVLLLVLVLVGAAAVAFALAQRQDVGTGDPGATPTPTVEGTPEVTPTATATAPAPVPSTSAPTSVPTEPTPTPTPAPTTEAPTTPPTTEPPAPTTEPTSTPAAGVGPELPVIGRPGLPGGSSSTTPPPEDG